MESGDKETHLDAVSPSSSGVPTGGDQFKFAVAEPVQSFPPSLGRAASHCFFGPAEVCSFAAGSHYAWMTVRLFVTLVMFGFSFDHSWVFGKQFAQSTVENESCFQDPPARQHICAHGMASVRSVLLPAGGARCFMNHVLRPSNTGKSAISNSCISAGVLLSISFR